MSIPQNLTFISGEMDLCTSSVSRENLGNQSNPLSLVISFAKWECCCCLLTSTPLQVPVARMI